MLKLEHPRYFTNPFLETADEKAKFVTNEWILDKINVLSETLMNRQISEDELSEGCVYTGIGGIVYSFISLNKNNEILNAEKRSEFCNKYLKLQFNYTKGASTSRSCRYLVGTLGLFTTQAISNTLNKLPINEIVTHFKNLVGYVVKPGYQPHGDDEILNGRAGFLAAVLMLRLDTGNEILKDEEIKRILKAMINSGIEYSQKHNSSTPLMYEWHNSEYLGAAHGLSGILQIILSFWHLLDSSSKNYVKETLDWFLSLQTTDGNFPSSTKHIGKDKGEDELVHWCHGASGAIYLFIIAYRIFKTQKYLDASRKCAELIWQKGILRKGPGICHGVAGSGYALLLMYRLTNDKKYLNMAKVFALILMSSDFQKHAKTPDSPFSLFEGWAGALCFLADLLRPDNAQFPLIPVPFSD